MHRRDDTASVATTTAAAVNAVSRHVTRNGSIFVPSQTFCLVNGRWDTSVVGRSAHLGVSREGCVHVISGFDAFAAGVL